MTSHQTAAAWDLEHGVVDFSETPVVMGVLNVTPDSFSDGGLYRTADDAIRRADQMVDEGAGIIDVGPESTRPGAAAVPPETQIERIQPVIRGLRARHPQLPISIDTRSAIVAKAAIGEGADIINDVSALSHDAEMAPLAAATGVPVILMHMRGSPATMQDALHDHSYTDVVSEIVSYLQERIACAEASGIARHRIAIDPGLGFGKTVQHNLSIMSNIEALTALGVPVVIGASRKSFLGTILDQFSPQDRTAGSLACAVAATLQGAHIIRAHDVADTVEAVRIAAAIRASS